MKPPRVTIVIPAFNCEKTIPQCLKACLAQSYSGEIEIIVVDDGSTDSTAQKIQAFPKIKYIYQKNAGPASARNCGAAQSSGEFICFTDSDCIPHADWVEKLMGHFDDTQVAVVSGSYGIANPQKLLARCVQAEIIWRHKSLLPKFPKSFGSYNFCVRKNVLSKVGSFDSSYRFASGEDNDLSYKVLQSGLKIFFAPEALVDHFHPEQLAKYLREQYRHGYWRAKLYRNHPGMSRGDDYTFWKDMLEVPLAAILVVILPCLAWIPESLNVAVFSLFALLFLEILFAFFVIAQPAFLTAFYWAGVMTLRAFSRTAGFFVGVLRFFF